MTVRGRPHVRASQPVEIQIDPETAATLGCALPWRTKGTSTVADDIGSHDADRLVVTAVRELGEQAVNVVGDGLEARSMKAVVDAIHGRASRRRTTAPAPDFDDVPPIILNLLERVRRPDLRASAFERVVARVLPETCWPDTDHVDRRRAWTRALEGTRRDETLRVVRRLIDDVLSVAHVSSLVQPVMPVDVPAKLLKVRATNGVLTIRDSWGATPFGSKSYMDSTPVEVFAYSFAFWKGRLPSTEKHRAAQPGVLDPFAGSRTGEMFFRALGGRVVSSDLTPAGDSGVACLDARELGTLIQHGAGPREKYGPGSNADVLIIREPDLVLLHAPSRGRPTHSEEYGGVWPALDLALLGRAAYIETVAEIVKKALSKIHPNGVVSLLVGEGVRSAQSVRPDVGLGDEIVKAVGSAGRCLKSVLVVNEGETNQTSLATTRVPMRLFLLGRAS